MRSHMRPLLLCIIALAVAGCSNSDRPAEPPSPSLDYGVLNVCELPPGTGCLGDWIWDDLNCNGLQDPGEPGREGVVVKLYSCPEDVLVDETVTDASGFYKVCGPAPDDYYIVVELPEGCTFSPKDAGQGDVRDVANDSDVDADGYGWCTNLYEGECEDAMDAGLCCPGVPCTSSIGDRMWFDTNCNGIQDAEETSGPEGVAVELYNCDTGGLVASTTTGADGYYLFSGLAEGNYKVCFDLPDGYTFSPADMGSADGVDSDALGDGCTACFALECDKPNMTKDAGLCEEKGGGEGCTPGFWRNHLYHWGPTGYTPDMYVNDVFGCELVEGDVTLGEAIDAPQTYGVLVFHAIAAILNASHPDVDYAFDVDDVIDYACDGNKDALAWENEMGCPLSNGNTTGGGGRREK